jgi:signal transduction histidine kinase
MSAEANKASFLSFMEQFYDRGNIAAVHDLTAPDFIDHTPHRGQGSDRQSFAAGMIALREMLEAAIPDFRVETQLILAEGDLVAARVTVQGERTGPLFGLPLSAGRLPITAIVLVRMRDGKVVELWQEQNVVLAEEAATYQERQRLARDLHDSVTQSIFSVSMLARAAQAQHDQNAPRLGPTLDRVATLAQQALVEMRALLFELRADAIAEEGLGSALEKLVEAIRVRTELAITLTLSSALDLSPIVTETVFRVVQEALSNAAKHGHATGAEVTVNAEKGLVVTVCDNGTGFDPAAVAQTVPDGRAGGMGLRFMRERATAAGLTLDITSAPGAGTTVRLEAASA